ncbi:unnamed protein product [Enterobius vermicularis]|uniref:Protein phosphatase 1 regulatory subunit 21 n=1 Tax=Enterobius vermicularis TaxID=51028 RepID=A0A158QAZ3_ENTVE|nr:unnamed protein product [Enterobius vermicularis]
METSISARFRYCSHMIALELVGLADIRWPVDEFSCQGGNQLMSTISSNVDLTTKYQRIAAEYAKSIGAIFQLKTQIPVLKNAFFDEQAKSKRLTEEVQSKVAFMRKLESEIESLEFRNEQLLKRVESLQAEVEELRRVPLKEKKNSSHRHAIAKPVVDEDRDILKNELEIKIQENELLHSKIEELSVNFEKGKQILEKKCADLEAQLLSLKPEQKTDVSDNDNKNDCDTSASAATNKRTDTTLPNSTQAQKVVSGRDVEGTLHALLNDAIQKAYIFFQGFVNLLRLFEQRSTVYPRDMVLEQLPKNTLLVWYELFKENIESENRVSWCGPNLCSCNELWSSKFLKFLDSLTVLSENIGKGLVAGNCIRIVSEASELLAECSELYNQKVFDENRLPTASKRLKCLNDCIAKCFSSISRSLENFVILMNLINSTSSLRQSAVAVETKNEEVVHPDVGGENGIVNKESTSTQLGSQCHCSELEAELRSTKCRIVSLEKERDRILVETELLKMKLNGGQVEPFNVASSANTTSGELYVVTSFYDRRIEELANEVQYLEGRAVYYENECLALIRLANLREAEKKELAKQLMAANKKVAQSNVHLDDMDTIQKGYKEQMKSLYEHMGELNTKIESQSETITSLRNGGIGGLKQFERGLGNFYLSEQYFIAVKTALQSKSPTVGELFFMRIRMSVLQKLLEILSIIFKNGP